MHLQHSQASAPSLVHRSAALEILFALKKLGETVCALWQAMARYSGHASHAWLAPALPAAPQLRPEESAYMAAHADALAQFESADDTVAKSAVQQVASTSM